MANDYEIVPEKDFDSLKNDVEKIRKDPIGNSVEGKAMKESIDRLNDSINSLLGLFKGAADSIKSESHDTEVMSKKILPLFDKVEKLSEQNEKIAKGIVALADMVEELKAKQAQAPTQQISQQNRDEEKPRPRFEQPSFGGGMNPLGAPPMPSQQQMSLPQGGLPPMDDFSNPFGSPQGGQPLPRFQMPPPPQGEPQAPKKKGIFGFK